MTEANSNIARDAEKDNWQTPGILLRRARRDSGLAEEDIVEQLGLTLRAVRALEADDYEKLPGPVYIKGYIRRYCDLVQLRARPVLSCFESHYREEVGESEPGDQESPQDRHTPALKLESYRPGAAKLTLGAALVVLVAALVVVWVAFAGEDTRTPVPVSAVGHEAQLAAVSKDLAAVSQERTPPSAKSGTGQPAVARPDAPAETRTASVEPAPDSRLVLAFSADSWVEVVDANDQVLVVDLKQAGSTLALEGLPPFQVMVGYAPGVRIEYRGQPVQVRPNPQSQVATLTIGP